MAQVCNPANLFPTTEGERSDEDYEEDESQFGEGESKRDDYSKEASDNEDEEDEDEFGLGESGRPSDARAIRSNKAKLKKLQADYDQYCCDIKKDEDKNDYRFTDLRNTQYMEISKLFSIFACSRFLSKKDIKV